MRLNARPSSRALLAAAAALALAACANDPGDEPRDTGGSADGSGDAGADAGTDVGTDAGSPDSAPDPACEGEIVPFDGDPCDCEGADVDGTDGLCTRACSCDGGFWACDETCDEPDPLVLRWVDEPALAEVTGNGDAAVEPGERWAVEGSIAADNGPDGGITVDLRLDSLSGKVSLTDSAATLDGVDAAGADFSLPFDVDDDASEGSVALDVEAFTTNGLASLNDTVTVEIAGITRGELRVDEDDLVELEGDGNRFVDPGERWALDITIVNEGNAVASGVSFAATTDSAALIVDTTSGDVGDLAADASSAVRIELTIAAAPADLAPVVTVTATSTDAGVAPAELDVSVDIEALDTLVWHRDELSIRQAAGAGNDDAVADPGETWEAVVPVSNSGTVAITGLSVSVTNFETPHCGVDTDCGASGVNRCDELTPNATTCAGDEDCGPIGVCGIGLCEVGSCAFSCADGDPCLVGTCVEGWCEAPVYRSAGFRLSSAPDELAPGANAEVVAAVTLDASTPDLARVFFSATSDVRTRPHASAAVDAALPVP